MTLSILSPPVWQTPSVNHSPVMDKSRQLVDDTQADSDGVFVQSEWIKTGKKYGAPGFPDFVHAGAVTGLFRD